VFHVRSNNQKTRILIDMKERKVVPTKVAYFTHPTAFNLFGGAELQILKTKGHIKKTSNDFHIKFFDIFQDKLEDFSIFHNFQMSPDCLSICKLAKTRGVKVALSPIFWTQANKEKITLKNQLAKLRNAYQGLTEYGFLTFQTLKPYKDFLDLANIILPNSEMEASFISSAFRIERKKFHVVPNGVEKSFSCAKPDLFVQEYGLKDFILYVGRIEPKKNVINLLHACKNLGAPVVIIGQKNLLHADYCELFEKMIASNRNFKYLGFLPFDSEILASAYAAAKVFVMPSWFETPSLSALEAGLAGCNIVITIGGSTSEYFKGLVRYVDPRSTKNIKKEISESLEEPKTTALRQLILNSYTWDIVAEKTIEAYNMISG